jgi:hypothetical protein
MMIITGFTNPMINKMSNTLDLANEAFILLVTYHLYQFTDFMTDLEMRTNVGLSMILFTVLSVLISIGNVVLSTLSLSLRKLKLRHMAWKLRREKQKQLKAKLHRLKMSEMRKMIRAEDE